MHHESLLELHDKLREDTWRSRHAFSKDMQQASQLMLKPFAYDHEVAEVLRQWCLKRQPCQFGRTAANRKQIYFCVLCERDLADGDDAIRTKIAAAKRHWKQRAVSDQVPPHSFLLLFATDRLLHAAPDENLRRFADGLLELAGWATPRRAKRQENPISSDFLYLRHPQDDRYWGFQFNVDFFAAAGDRRWWHDHRLPGGIGLTANSTGHMKAYLDWYKEPGSDHGDWALKQAMLTIAQAHPTKGSDSSLSPGDDPRADGRLTWLRKLDERGRPLVPHLACPLTNPPKQLQGADWTRYEGLIHTDHAVREEFFADRPEAITQAAPYLQDLTYLFDRQQEDFVNFTSGKSFTEEEVFIDLGAAESWSRRTAVVEDEAPRSAAEDTEIAELMTECLGWTPSEDYIDAEALE